MDEQHRAALKTAAAAGATTAGAQMALGSGAAGIVGGAFAPFVVEAVQWFSGLVVQRGEAKAARMLAVAAETMDVGLDILFERAQTYDERVELLARVLGGAARSTLEEKIPALGKVLAQGLTDREDIDEALILAAALSAVEAPHVLVLQHIADNPEVPPEWQPVGVGPRLGWWSESLCKAMPKLAGIVDALLPVLASHGLVRDTTGVSYASQVGPSQWSITPLGRRCLFLLNE